MEFSLSLPNNAFFFALCTCMGICAGALGQMPSRGPFNLNQMWEMDFVSETSHTAFTHQQISTPYRYFWISHSRGTPTCVVEISTGAVSCSEGICLSLVFLLLHAQAHGTVWQSHKHFYWWKVFGVFSFFCLFVCLGLKNFFVCLFWFVLFLWVFFLFFFVLG